MIHPVPRLSPDEPPRTSDSYDRFGSDGRVHKGSDLMYRRPAKGPVALPTHSAHYFMPNGIPALAIMDGKVTASNFIGTGGRTKIAHADGLESGYYHLQKLNLRVGQGVKAGQPVGLIYHNPEGYRLNHLHFAMWKNGNYIDPGPYLNNAQVMDIPGMPLWLKISLVAAAGFAVSRYIR